MKMGALPISACTAALLLFVTVGTASAGKHKFINFDVPSASGTFPADINKNNDVAGSYRDHAQSYHGFIRIADGTITTFDVPGASSTNVGGINNVDQILGTFADSKSMVHGFVRSLDGNITIFDPSGSTETDAVAINDKGEITGGYYETGGGALGFLRNKNGKFVTFEPDGAAYTFGLAINNGGAVAGAYCPNFSCNPYDAFVRSPEGTITTFSVSEAVRTIPVAINSQGEIAGYYVVSDGESSGFLRDPAGQIVLIGCASITGLNDKGWIVGYTFDSDGYHGCLRAPDGSMSTFNDPNADGGEGTTPSDINNSRYVIGYYPDSGLTYHGFIVLPPK